MTKASKTNGRNDLHQCSPSPLSPRPRTNFWKLFIAKRNINKTPPSFFLSDDTRVNIEILTKHQTDEELHELHTKVDLLHSFLPQEIVETIEHHWMMNGDYKETDSLTACSSISSSQLDCIPLSISIPNNDSKEIGMHDEEGGDFSIHVHEESSSSPTTFSKALYSKEANDVSIVFVNIDNFSKISNEISPSEVLNMLQDLFHRFDAICKEHHVLKLDTIGDAYLCCSGFSQELSSDPLHVLGAAKEMVRAAKEVPIPKLLPSSPQEYLSVRIGIHIGDATFGVLGQSLPKLICVGSTVNMAARMEQTSAPNHIHVTSEFHDIVGENEDGWECCETVKIKNMGEVEAYLLDPLKGEKESQWC